MTQFTFAVLYTVNADTRDWRMVTPEEHLAAFTDRCAQILDAEQQSPGSELGGEGTGGPIKSTDDLPPLPEGVTMIGLGDPEVLHRTIAEAVGEADEPHSDCVHEWAFTGTAYGGDDPRWHGEGRCYCVKCGADGDA